MVRVKFCGMTRPEDAAAAADLGVDAIGVVFVPRSKRAVGVDQAQEVLAALPPLVSTVGLFMDSSADEVRAVLDRVPLNWLQFHGSESAAFCAAFGRPWIKAVSVTAAGDVQYHEWSDASAVLLDSHAAGQMGGSGRTFDWAAIEPPDRPWILAGGLDADNVGSALERLRPPAVDVSSGIESAPGIKDRRRMQQFMERVRHG